MKNPLKRDPSRTTMLRSRYMADMRRRFGAVSRAIQELIVKEDALGLITSEPLTFMQKQVWRFNTDANKIKSYRKWLQQQIDAKILTVDAVSGKPWNATYAESAYRKGMTRAYTQIHATELAKSIDFYEGTKAQFLRDAFAQPIALSKIELMYNRAFDELKGVTAAMGQQMSRTLASGLLKGDGPRAIARELRKNVSNITKTRAIVIARTEVIMVHAEGQLDAFEMLGVKEVGIMAEWSTAGDDRVCERCGALEGSVMTVDEARGQIPLHPNCRCIWIPYLKGVSKRKTRKEIREKLKTAIPRWPSTKRKAKIEPLPPPPTETRVGVTFSKINSKEFNNIVNDTIESYPEKVKVLLNDNGISFKAGNRLTELFPELKGKHPRGWPAGTTWDSVSGIFHLKTKSISVVENYRPIRKKIFIKTSKSKVEGILNHETGHAFNRSQEAFFSETLDFKKAYRIDTKAISQIDIAKNNLRYFYQKRTAGRDEAFAETFANIVGQGSTEKFVEGKLTSVDVRKFFPNVTNYVKGLLK